MLEFLTNNYRCADCNEDVGLLRSFRKDSPECTVCGSKNVIKLTQDEYLNKDKQGESSKKAIPVYHS